MDRIELGLDTFGDVTNGADGQPKPMDQVLRDVVQEGIVADQAGVHFLGLGEHHRPDFAISSPEILLAAIAGQDKPAWVGYGGDSAVLGRSDPGVPALFHPERSVERAGRGDSGAGVFHRKLSAVWLCAGGLRGSV